MKFSIIIPVYNAEKYLAKTLEHTLKLNNDCFEIVLIDDGSTDNSPKLCDQYAEIYPGKVQVIHQYNQGQLAARCNGIQVACGKYCLFLDADDALQDNCLNELQRLLDKYDNPDVVIYSFLYENPDGTTRPAVKICEGEKLFTDKTELYKLFFTSTLLNNVWTKLVKREVLLRCEIDVERYKMLRCSEDRLHSMEMLTQAKHVVYTDQAWYRYRLVEDSVTRQFAPSAIDRFNDSILYGITGDYLKKWQLEFPEWKIRMDAQWANEMLYVFDLFYTQCAEKKRIMAYDWNSFLPPEVQTNYIKNPYINEIRKQYLTWIFEKNQSRIDFYIWKREIRKKLKAMLKRK